MLECPFCPERELENEHARMVHVLDKHSTRLAMASVVIQSMRTHEVTFLNYRSYVEGVKKEALR